VAFLLSGKKEQIASDVAANSHHPVFYAAFTILLLESPYFRTLFYHRLPKLFSYPLRIFYPKCPSFIIDVNTPIGSGLRLAHPYSTILNAANIGKNVYVNHLVTVGEINGQKPIIDDDVELHAGCIVVGAVHIGKGARIGAGAVVVKDVPAYATAVGNPARIISKEAHPTV